MVTSMPTINRLMQHIPTIRLGCDDPGARPTAVTAPLPADVLVGVFAFANMSPTNRCAHRTKNFKKALGPGRPSLNSDHLHDHSIGALPIKFRIEHPLPGSEVEFAFGHRQRAFMVQ